MGVHVLAHTEQSGVSPHQNGLTMLLTVSCVLLLVAASNAATTTPAPTEPPKCCFDKEFSAVLGEAGGTLANGVATTLEGSVLLGYDFYRQRQGSVTTLRHPDGSVNITYTIQDYANRVSYVTGENGVCNSYRMPNTEQMYPPCVPDDARYLGAGLFGYGPETLAVHTWEYTLPHSDVIVKMALTEGSCVPVVEALYGHIAGASTEITYFFTSSHPGIEDLNRLNPPDNCPFVNPGNNNGAVVGRRSLGGLARF